MKRQILTLLVLLGLTLPAAGAAPRNEKPFTLPEVQQWQGGKGSFTPTSADDARITYRLKADHRMPADGYTIAITAKGIAATAPTEQGLAFARTTVAQLMERSADGSQAVAAPSATGPATACAASCWTADASSSPCTRSTTLSTSWRTTR